MITEMEMPTPCQKCRELFDLNDGQPSYEWFPGYSNLLRMFRERG
jgi:hypothetical protein